MADDPHVVALLALLNATTIPAVYDEEVPPPETAEEAYVRPYFHFLATETDVLTWDSGDAEVRMYAHCVAATAMGARIIASLVRDAVLDVVPTIAGRTCWPIRHEQSVPPTRDETTGRMVMDQVDVYVLRSTPA